MSLRKRIANSRLLNRTVIGLFASYLRFAFRTTSWQIEGRAEMDAALAEHGSVILVLWHQRIAFSPYMFDAKGGQILSITSTARAGRLAGQIQAAFGFATVAFSSKKANLAASRQVVRMIRDGYSIGIAADGPRGPAREAKLASIEWARMTQKPVFLVTFSVARSWRWKTWDRMILPYPFNRGRMVHRPWAVEVPRKLSPEQAQVLRQTLQDDLSALTDAVDADMI